MPRMLTIEPAAVATLASINHCGSSEWFVLIALIKKKKNGSIPPIEFLTFKGFAESLELPKKPKGDES